MSLISGFLLSRFSTIIQCPICTCEQDVEDAMFRAAEMKQGFSRHKCIGCKRKILISSDFTGNAIAFEIEQKRK